MCLQLLFPFRALIKDFNKFINRLLLGLGITDDSFIFNFPSSRGQSEDLEEEVVYSDGQLPLLFPVHHCE